MIGIGFGEFLVATAKKTGVEKYDIAHPSFRLAWRAFRNPGNLMADCLPAGNILYVLRIDKGTPLVRGTRDQR